MCRIVNIGVGDEIEVAFYRKSADNVFRLPVTDDTAVIVRNDLHTMLPEPTTLSGSKTREQRGLKFNIEFGNEIR